MPHARRSGVRRAGRPAPPPVPPACAGLVATAVSFQAASIWSSSAVSSGSSATWPPGSAAMPSRRTPRCSARRAMVCGLEQVGVVGHGDEQVAVLLLELHGHVEVRGRRRQLDVLDLDARAAGARPAGRSAARPSPGTAACGWVALRLHGVDDPLERNVLVLERLADVAAHGRRGSRRRCAATIRRAQHQGVDEEPDHPSSSARSRPEVTVPTATSSLTGPAGQQHAAGGDERA